MSKHPRPFYCSECHTVALGVHPPTRWFGLYRHHVDRPVQNGLFCSATCLQQRAEQLVELAEIVEAAKRAAAARDQAAQEEAACQAFVDPTMA